MEIVNASSCASIDISSPCLETCVIAHVHVHTCKIPGTSEKSPVPTSLATMQSHMPNKNFAVATATLVTVTFCCHNSALSCFILNETFDMLQQQETLYFGCTNLGSHVQFQIIKSNHLYRQGCMCELMLLLQFLPGIDCISKSLFTYHYHNILHVCNSIFLLLYCFWSYW